MSTSIQAFLAQATRKAASDLEAAVLRVPEDKRGWSPMDRARPALDLAAECAILNGRTAELIQTRLWPFNDMAAYTQAKAELARDWSALRASLEANTAKAAAAIEAIPDGDLAAEVQMPWGSMALAQVAAYPYWNMSYHEGQINYIAAMLGCIG